MNYSDTSKLLTALLIFSVTLVSCGDDPASVDEDPPEIPTFEETILEPDLSYFENNNPQKTGANVSPENFNTAKAYATGLSSFAALGQLYAGLFVQANQEEAEFQDGQWIWEYSHNVENMSFTVVLTAEDTGNQTLWSMTFSSDDGEGNVIEDYTILEGSMANDGSSGSWTFNALVEETSEEIPVLVTNWAVESETKVTIDTDIYNEEGVTTETFSYEQNGTEHLLSLTGANTDNDILVFWNTEIMTGYYQIGSDTSNRNCWDSEFQNINCSDVGF